jgi:small GTP-binding protein
MAQQDYKVDVLDQDPGDYDLSFKLIVVGDSGVGKSCLTIKATKNNFDSIYSPTIGFEFLTFFIKIEDLYVKLQIWDTCGQEVYRSLISSFYHNSSLALLVYAIDEKNSFIHLDSWLNEIRTHGNPDINIFVIGNKVDLENKRVINRELAQDFVEKNNAKLFLETSAKTGFNAQNVFIEATKLLYEQHLQFKDRISRPDTLGNIVGDDVNKNIVMETIDEEESNKSRKKGCC